MGELQQQKLSNQIKSDNMMHKQFTYAVVVCLRYTVYTIQIVFFVQIFLYASISFIEHIVPIVPTDTILVK